MKTKKSKSWADSSKELYNKGLELGIDIYSGKKIKQKKNNKKYCYLVYCNKDPIVYSVYSNSKSAIQYAEYLLDYRKKLAKERDLDLGFYHHFYNFEKDNHFDDLEKTIFSCCLRILDKDGKRYDKYPEDATKIQVVRKPLFSSFKD